MTEMEGRKRREERREGGARERGRGRERGRKDERREDLTPRSRWACNQNIVFR